MGTSTRSDQQRAGTCTEDSAAAQGESRGSWTLGIFKILEFNPPEYTLYERLCVGEELPPFLSLCLWTPVIFICLPVILGRHVYVYAKSRMGVHPCLQWPQDQKDDWVRCGVCIYNLSTPQAEVEGS